MVTTEKLIQQDRGDDAYMSALPAVRHPGFAKHWCAGDKGGAELMTATFGSSGEPAPLRIGQAASRHERPTLRAPGLTHLAASPPSRRQATLALLLLALAILLAEPAASLIGRL